jgi:hypothetical protein
METHIQEELSGQQAQLLQQAARCATLSSLLAAEPDNSCRRCTMQRATEALLSHSAEIQASGCGRRSCSHETAHLHLHCEWTVTVLSYLPDMP